MDQFSFAKCLLSMTICPTQYALTGPHPKAAPERRKGATSLPAKTALVEPGEWWADQQIPCHDCGQASRHGWSGNPSINGACFTI
jgi:hypothetical protein